MHIHKILSHPKFLFFFVASLMCCFFFSQAALAQRRQFHGNICYKAAQSYGLSDSGDSQDINEASPFGFHHARRLVDYVSDLGVKWVRVNAVWKIVQPTEEDVISGSFDWRALEKSWNFRAYQNMGIHLLVTISLLGGVTEHSYVPDAGAYNESAYLKFVKDLVERYDGDGIHDAPDLKNPIRFWQVENEPPKQLRDFAKLQEITYQAVKETCADCKVLIGGIGQISAFATNRLDRRMPEIFKELNGRFIDIIDFHSYGTADDYSVQESLRYLKVQLQSAHFDIDILPFWITEMGTYSGQISDFGRSGKSDAPYQSEQQQACGLVKRYTASLGLGVKKIFWAWGILEGFKRERGFFDFTGLIYDGEFDYDLGRGVKKLSYYAYKKMTEKLEGSDWNRTETIVDNSNPVDIYKFYGRRGPIWVAWSDHPFSYQLYVGESAKRVRVESAVPFCNLGRDVADYRKAFKVQEKDLVKGSVLLELDEVPVYVEIIK